MGGADAPLRNAELAGLAFADAASDVVAVLPDNSTDAATSKYLTAAHGRSHCGRRVGRVHVRIARLRRRDPLCRTYRHLRQFSKLRPTRPRRHYHPFSKPRPHRRLRYRPPPQTCPSGVGSSFGGQVGYLACASPTNYCYATRPAGAQSHLHSLTGNIGASGHFSRGIAQLQLLDGCDHSVDRLGQKRFRSSSGDTHEG